MRRRFVVLACAAASVVLALLGLAGLATAAEPAADPVPTSLEVAMDPPYAYPGDEITLTVTVAPNPGAGSVAFHYGWGLVWETSGSVPLDPATGTATFSAIARDELGSGMAVSLWFNGSDGFAPSETVFRVDLRFLPNVVITDAPDATRSADASVSFIASAETECRLDGASWAGCTSPHELTGLAEGHHELDIRAFNPDGRRGPVQTAAFDRDLTPPVPGDVRIDGGITTTNTWNGHTLHYPATDALSGILKVRVSFTGETDTDGNLVYDPLLVDSYDRRWIDGPSTAWYADMRASGPQATWVQWFDEAGNGSAIEQLTVDVRSAVPELGGLWATVDPTVPFSVAGIDAAEIQAIRITNGWPGDPGEVELDEVPTAWTLDPSGGPGIRTVSISWLDAQGSWSSPALVAVRLLDAPVPDLVLDLGSGVTHDPVVQGWTSFGTEMHRGVTTAYAYSCDGTSWRHGIPVSASVWIDVDDPDAGCPVEDGPRTIHLRFRYGASWAPGETRLSDERTAVVDLQRDPSLPESDISEPQGSVVVAGGVASVPSSVITLAVPATDDDAVTRVRLSNDGVTWAERAYAPSQAWTLAPGNGTRTVWARWRDAAGSWSLPASDSVIVDTTRPTTSSPRVSLLEGSRTTRAGSVEALVSWRGTDTGTGVAAYRVQMRVDGDAWTTLSPAQGAPRLQRILRGSHTYAFRVRAVDRAGNLSAWAESATVRRTLVDDASPAVRWSDGWRRSVADDLVGGSERVTRRAGIEARVAVVGRSVAWVATTGPGRGRATVIVDGVAVAVVDLDRAGRSARRVVWSMAWPSAGSHTVVIRALEPKVGVDAFIVLR